MIFMSFVETIQETTIRELINAVSFFIKESINSKISKLVGGRCKETI